MKTTEVAQRIDAHLKRFEADPVINFARSVAKPYDRAFAHVSGGWVRIRYAFYWDTHSLCKADAERYLVWLDAGGVGRYFEAFSEAQP